MAHEFRIMARVMGLKPTMYLLYKPVNKSEKAAKNQQHQTSSLLSVLECALFIFSGESRRRTLQQDCPIGDICEESY
jgi:hypothetical protein